MEKAKHVPCNIRVVELELEKRAEEERDAFARDAMMLALEKRKHSENRPGLKNAMDKAREMAEDRNAIAYLIHKGLERGVGVFKLTEELLGLRIPMTREREGRIECAVTNAFAHFGIRHEAVCVRDGTRTNVEMRFVE